MSARYCYIVYSSGPLSHLCVCENLTIHSTLLLFSIVSSTSPCTPFPFPHPDPWILCILPFSDSIMSPSSFLWSWKVQYRRERWRTRSASPDRRGIDYSSLVRRAPWPAGFWHLSPSKTAQDRAKCSQERTKSLPRATKDCFKLLKKHRKLFKSGSKASRSGPRPPPEFSSVSREPSPAPPGMHGYLKSIFFLMVFHAVSICHLFTPRPWVN